MKTLQLLLIPLISGFFLPGIHAQTLQGGCTSVSIDPGSIPAYPTVYFQFVSWIPCYKSGCCRIITFGSKTTPEYWLQKQNSNGSWSFVGSPQEGTVFNNLGHGTYRVRVRFPMVDASYCNPPQPLKLYNIAGQYLGEWGRWDDNNIVYTNTAIVAATVASYLSVSFIDSDGSNNSSIGFDFSENVSINTSGSKNYDAWYMEIRELDGPQRTKSNGWSAGQISNLDLALFWDAFEFVTNRSYIVHFAIDNMSCHTTTGNTTNTERYFFICPAGSGCRGAERVQEIKVSPNPTTSAFSMAGIDLTSVQSLVLNLCDLSGKTVRQFMGDPSNVYHLDGLSNGIYVLDVTDRSGSRVYRSKISVMK